MAGQSCNHAEAVLWHRPEQSCSSGQWKGFPVGTDSTTVAPNLTQPSPQTPVAEVWSTEIVAVPWNWYSVTSRVR